MDQIRIRRRNEFPPFARQEAKRRASYRRTQSFMWSGLPITLKFRLSRWSWLAEVKEGIRYRRMFCWVVAQKKRVSAFELFEYEMAFDLGNDEVFELMDSESSIASNLAEVICDAWDRFSDEVSAYGSLLDFRMAWSDPNYGPHGLWAAAAKKLISQEFDSHALLTMKAFPLEYEGKAPTGSGSRTGLILRQRAMIRHYQKTFGVAPFPGQAGEEGWLYKINSRFAQTVEGPRTDSKERVTL
jgi:hypothetical protein